MGASADHAQNFQRNKLRTNSLAPVRVALIHTQYLTASGGGMERYLRDLIAGFLAAGHVVTVITSKVDHPENVPSGVEIILHNLSLVPKPLRRGALNRRVGKTLSEQRSSQNFDLTIAIADVQGADINICGGAHAPFQARLHIRPTLLDRIQLAHEKKIYESAKQIVAHSLMMKHDLLEFFDIPERRISVIYPPVDSGRFKRPTEEQRASFRRRFVISEDKFTLLFVSTGHGRKGLRPLLEALELLQQGEYELLIAGSRSDGVQTKAGIRYLGYVSDMAQLYAAADVTVLPSQYEPFGLVVIESLLCGTPALISKQVAARELLEENEYLLLDDITPECIASSVRQARRKKFDVPADFAEKKGVTIEKHIAALLSEGRR